MVEAINEAARVGILHRPQRTGADRRRTRNAKKGYSLAGQAPVRGRVGRRLELQKLADETGLEISVCHFPPGTSKWNKIEHRLFSFITKNWRGKPLVSHEVIVNLIAATTTRTGLRVRSQLDTGKYPKGIKVGKQEFAAIHLCPDTFHGEWNYSIMPRS